MYFMEGYLLGLTSFLPMADVQAGIGEHFIQFNCADKRPSVRGKGACKMRSKRKSGIDLWSHILP